MEYYWAQKMRVCRLKSFHRDEHGSTITLFAGFMLAVAGLSALAIDASYLYTVKTELQVTADATATSAVVQLPDENAARTIAVQYAGKNMASNAHGQVLVTADVEPGNWDAGSRSFTPAGNPLNAVRVTTKRAQANGNAVQLFFAQAIGFGTIDINAVAIGLVQSNGCLTSGIMAGGTVQLNQGVTIGNNYCIYGATSVNFDQDGTVQGGSYIVSDDLNNITHGPNFSAPANALVEATHDVSTGVNAGQLIDDIELGNSWPPFINNLQVVADVPDNPAAGTAYVINNNVVIDKNVTASDVVIAVRGTISWGQNGVIQHSNPGCTNGDPAVAIIATGDLDLGQNSTVDGAQLITAGDLWLHQQANFSGSAIVGGNVQIDQGAATENPCTSVFGPPGVGVDSLSRLVF